MNNKKQITIFASKKIKMLKDNPKIIFYWFYKLFNLFRKNVLNNGERYDPNILGNFNINDFHQEARYNFAQKFISKNDSVIDIACGTGYGTALLADNCLSVIGVDISEEAIRYANKHYKKKSNINFIQSGLFDFNGLADIVISFETIEHINDSIEATVKKLLSLAKNKIICSVPYKEAIGNNKYHSHFNISELDFDFLKNNYKLKFLYQTSDGKIWEENKGDISTLIIIIAKNFL
jgi:SAM-dependent methyltransferase